MFVRAAVNWIAWILQRANRWLEFHKLAEKPNFDQNGVGIIYFNLKVNWLWKVNDLYCYWTVNDWLTLNFLGRLNDSGNFHLVFSLRGKMYWLAGNVGHFKVFLVRFRLLVPCESKQHKRTSRTLLVLRFSVNVTIISFIFPHVCWASTRI